MHPFDLKKTYPVIATLLNQNTGPNKKIIRVQRPLYSHQSVAILRVPKTGPISGKTVGVQHLYITTIFGAHGSSCFRLPLSICSFCQAIRLSVS